MATAVVFSSAPRLLLRPIFRLAVSLLRRYFSKWFGNNRSLSPNSTHNNNNPSKIPSLLLPEALGIVLSVILLLVKRVLLQWRRTRGYGNYETSASHQLEIIDLNGRDCNDVHNVVNVRQDGLGFAEWKELQVMRKALKGRVEGLKGKLLEKMQILGRNLMEGNHADVEAGGSMVGSVVDLCVGMIVAEVVGQTIRKKGWWEGSTVEKDCRGGGDQVLMDLRLEDQKKDGDVKMIERGTYREAERGYIMRGRRTSEEGRFKEVGWARDGSLLLKEGEKRSSRTKSDDKEDKKIKKSKSRKARETGARRLDKKKERKKSFEGSQGKDLEKQTDYNRNRGRDEKKMSSAPKTKAADKSTDDKDRVTAKPTQLPDEKISTSRKTCSEQVPRGNSHRQAAERRSTTKRCSSATERSQKEKRTSRSGSKEDLKRSQGPRTTPLVPVSVSKGNELRDALSTSMHRKSVNLTRSSGKETELKKSRHPVSMQEEALCKIRPVVLGDMLIKPGERKKLERRNSEKRMRRHSENVCKSKRHSSNCSHPRHLERLTKSK